MTDANHNSSRPEPLPADHEAELRRVDEALAAQAAHERATHAIPVGLSDRVYEASAPLLVGAEETPAGALSPMRRWRLPMQVLAAAAVVALMVTVGAVLWSMAGQSRRSPGPIEIARDAPSLLRQGSMPIVETLESDYDARLSRTGLVLERVASSDLWTGPSVWEQVDSELITTVEGW
ncbi:MAG: hypothetical protein ACF8NJ_01185 [Phycisphaerales bacterium JB038]